MTPLRRSSGLGGDGPVSTSVAGGPERASRGRDGQETGEDEASAPQAGRLEIDLVRGELRRDGTVVPLRRKAWELLALLASRSGGLVGPDEIAAALWPNAHVSPQGIFTLVGELRDAFGDDEARQRLVTVRGRGYRLAPEAVVASTSALPPAPLLPTSHPCFVGRERELRVLASEWNRARGGEPRAVFVAGESGIGKSTLVNEAIARQVEQGGDRFRLARGACFQSRGGGEPFGPLIDAIGSWALQDDEVRATTFRLAPLWAERLRSARTVPSGPLAVLDTRPGQMQRQASDLLGELGRSRLHVLVLEDAHWADPYTLDLLRRALPRLGATRFLLLVTFRERDALQAGNPVDRIAMDLRDHGSLLDLGPLAPADASRLVSHRLGGDDAEAARRIVERAGGNPLFLEAFADQAEQSHRHSEATREEGEGMSEGLPRMFTRVVEAQWEALSAPAREAIEAGAVVGVQFDAGTVAAALGSSLDEVEAVLGRRSERPTFLSPAGKAITGGAVCASYRFRHEMFRRLVYDAIAPARAARLHGAIGRALAREAGESTSTRAGAVAEHLLLGGEHALAAEHFEKAANESVRGAAIPEAAAALERALECVGHLAAGRDRDRRELRLVIRHGLTCGWLRGPADPAVTAAYERGLPLLDRVEDPEVVGPAMRGIWLLRLVRFDYRGMLEIADRMTGLAEGRRAGLFRRQAACLRGGTLCFLGRQTEALERLEAARATRSSARATADVWGVDLDTEIACYAAWSATLAGRLGLAAERLAEARRRAAKADHLGTQMLVRWFEFSLAQLTGRRDDLERHLAEFFVIAGRENQEAWNAIAETLRATLELERGNADAMQLLMETLGGGDGQPTLLIARAYLLGQLAAAVARSGHGVEGLALVDAALRTIERNDGRVSESDFWRIKGQIHEVLGSTDEAEPALRRALDIARGQGAALFERRAALALAGLFARTGRVGEASDLLAGSATGLGPSMTAEEAAALPPLAAFAPPFERTD